jgi:hypothetical protein
MLLVAALSLFPDMNEIAPEAPPFAAPLAMAISPVAAAPCALDTPREPLFIVPDPESTTSDPDLDVALPECKTMLDALSVLLLPPRMEILPAAP